MKAELKRKNPVKFYKSLESKKLRKQICEIGRRLWEKGFVDGNGGNISLRINDNYVFCTPTLKSKGFLEIDDICLIDLAGDKLAGQLKPTSEIKVHLSIMQNTQAKACIHAHPVHAAAFLISGKALPSGVLPEFEIFVGEIGYAGYAEPGTEQIAKAVAKLAFQHQCIFMENHGVVVWDKGLEEAYWKIEIIDAYCHTLILQSSLGLPLKKIPDVELHKLYLIRQKLGMPEDRFKNKG